MPSTMDTVDHDPMKDLFDEPPSLPKLGHDGDHRIPPLRRDPLEGSVSVARITERGSQEERATPKGDDEMPEKIDLKSEAALAARVRILGAKSSLSECTKHWAALAEVFNKLDKKDHGAPVKALQAMIPKTQRLAAFCRSSRPTPRPGTHISNLSGWTLCTCTTNASPTFCESDNAHLLWITVCNRMLRAHNGQNFCYNSE